MTVTEKIVENRLLQAVARISMTISMPLMLMAVGYVVGMGESIAALKTDVALLKSSDMSQNHRLDSVEAQAEKIVDLLTEIKSDLNTIRIDAQYLRRDVEESRRKANEDNR